jgi:hypothetical protein
MNDRPGAIAAALPVDLDALPRLQRIPFALDADDPTGDFHRRRVSFAISMLVIAAQQIPDNIQALLAASA